MTLVRSNRGQGLGSETTLLVLGAEDVRELFDLTTAIRSQRHAFQELGAGRAQLAARLLLDGADGAVSFCYASRVSPADGAVTKFGSMVPANLDAGKPVVSAIVVALDADDGHPAAILEGTSLTELRTAAASAVAAAALARPGARTLAVLGSGVQAQAHIRALTHELAVESVRLFSPNRMRAEQAVAELGYLGIDVLLADDAESAVRGADIVVGCTTSASPVLEATWVSPGALVISVGSFAPDRHEVGGDLLARAGAVVVDHVETALEQAGPVIAAVAAGTLAGSDLISLGDVLNGRARVRGEADEVVFYNSVGVGVQDAAAAQAILAGARSRGLGTSLAW